MKYNIFFYFYPSFMTFFHGSGSGFLADPDPDKKRSDRDPGKKTESETLEISVKIAEGQTNFIKCNVAEPEPIFLVGWSRAPEPPFFKAAPHW